MQYKERNDFEEVLEQVADRMPSSFFAVEEGLKSEGYSFDLIGHDDRVIEGETEKDVFVYELESDEAVGFCLYREDGEVVAYALEPENSRPVV